jgi:hypothetical protein
MKGLITLLALGVLGAGGAWWYYQTQYQGAYKAAQTATQTAVDRARAQKANDDCRDACEQGAIVGQQGDEQLRACRARCDGKAGPAANRPYEPIRSISVAPADHRKTAPLPPESQPKRPFKTP